MSAAEDRARAEALRDFRRKLTDGTYTLHMGSAVDLLDHVSRLLDRDSALLAERQAPTPTDDQREFPWRCEDGCRSTHRTDHECIYDPEPPRRQPPALSGMTPEALAGLAEKARAARGGPWRVYETMQADTYVIVGERGLVQDDVICGPTYEQRNARFIAAASPDIVLALLAAFPVVGQAPPLPTREALMNALRAGERASRSGGGSAESLFRHQSDAVFALLSPEARDTGEDR